MGHPGWYIGFAIAFVLIWVVVICVATILNLARRISLQAIDIADALQETGENTDILQAVPGVTDQITGVYGAVGAVRSTFLEGSR